MKKLALILVLPFMLGGAFEIIPALPDLSARAEAARLGGGRSFGGSPSFNRSAPAPVRQAAPNQAAPGAAPRGGLMGGMFGPLLAGSMLGALLFGGAFSGMGMIDIVMIGLLVWMAMRLLRGRRPAQQHGGHGNARSAQGDYSDAWAGLRDSSSSSAAPGYADSGFVPPAGFDREKFMDGARLMYNRMQEAWDRRDLADIRQFTTPAMYSQIEAQAKEDPTPSTTTILTMQAQPHEFRREGDKEFIAVYFDVLMREYADRDAENARELWHFTRQSGGTWKLDGIQQVE